MQSNFTVEAQDVINELLEQIKQLSLSNAMLKIRFEQAITENQKLQAEDKKAK